MSKPLRCLLGLHDWHYSKLPDPLYGKFIKRGRVASQRDCRRCPASGLAVLRGHRG